MDALWERTAFVWMLTWLGHGCSVATGGLCVDVNMVGTWMLCGNGRALCGRLHGWDMEAVWEHVCWMQTLEKHRKTQKPYDKTKPVCRLSAKNTHDGAPSYSKANVYKHWAHERRSLFRNWLKDAHPNCGP